MRNSETNQDYEPCEGKSPNKLGPGRDQVEILHNCLSEKSIGDLMTVIGRSNKTKFKIQFEIDEWN